MIPERMQRAYDLFEQAIQRPPEEHSAFLIEACGDDAELRAEVESLLEHDKRTGDDFMRTPDVGPTAVEGAVKDPPDALIGTRVGAFHIKHLIASGGMGTVYEAVQEQPHRVVALKVMKRNVASHSALRRFQFEAQILGRLRHPNIAQIYQAGTHDDGSGGVPYFAMEYIPGARLITQYAKEKRLSISDRLWLFTKVCDAVHHGHQKGIIHRDLKPANILVDSAGEPNVIDFGVARATDSDMSLTTQQTCMGQLVGSVQYMSPEQCDADPHDLDTRSDVYALGVVLYELLTGELPYEASGTTIYAATRAIKEQTPRRPSSLNRRLRGDVETITLKALEKDRDRRYQSAAELSADIRRYLNGEPIEARPPNSWTRAVHWVTRHPTITAVVACLGVSAIVIVVVVSTATPPSRLPNEKPAQMEFFFDPYKRYTGGEPANRRPGCSLLMAMFLDSGPAERAFGLPSWSIVQVHSAAESWCCLVSPTPQPAPFQDDFARLIQSLAIQRLSGNVESRRRKCFLSCARSAVPLVSSFALGLADCTMSFPRRSSRSIPAPKSSLALCSRITHRALFASTICAGSYCTKRGTMAVRTPLTGCRMPGY
jgi:serine/threonine protein kinase